MKNLPPTQKIKTIAELIRYLGQNYPLYEKIEAIAINVDDSIVELTAVLCKPKEEPSPGFNVDSFTNIIADPSSWQNFLNMFVAAERIVIDFDTYGEALQSNSEGMYDETTSIEQLRGAVHRIKPEAVDGGDYLSWLTEEQQEKLLQVAAEILAWGNGEDIRDISCGIDDAKVMTPRERLETLKDDHEWRCRRLGFDPNTGIAIKN
jgi:hypothetical protein